MANEITILDLRNEDLLVLADLYREGIPHAVFCALGGKFIASFFRYLVERDEVCSLVGLNGDGRVEGVIVGTLNRSKGYRSVLKRRRWSLLAAAGWHLLSPKVFIWILRGVAARFRRRSDTPDLPDAELLLIVVRPEARGKGLAHRLLESMESRFRQMGFTGEYTIPTEADNLLANRFYQRIGATLVGTRSWRGLLINCYSKVVGTQPDKTDKS